MAWRLSIDQQAHLLLCIPSPALSCNENDTEHLDRDQPYPSSQKTKRMRTSFKHHQLRTMKSYFAINHNPDAKDLKQLAQKTGLTKRVLQVSRSGWSPQQSRARRDVLSLAPSLCCSLSSICTSISHPVLCLLSFPSHTPSEGVPRLPSAQCSVLSLCHTPAHTVSSRAPHAPHRATLPSQDGAQAPGWEDRPGLPLLHKIPFSFFCPPLSYSPF